MGEKGRVVFEAVHTDPDALIYWHLDNQFIISHKVYSSGRIVA